MPVHPPLELESVHCVFGEGPRRVHALVDASLSLAPRELVAVMGPSGSGKSTLLNVAGLLQPPSSGRVLVDGVDAATVSPARAAALRRTHIGMVFQRFNLIDTLTVGENVAVPLELGAFRRGSAEKPPKPPWQRSVWRTWPTAFRSRYPAARPSGRPSPGH